MAHGKIWPAHPKPLPNELLSSWIVRVAESNVIKLQTLSWMLFGNARSPWNRDIDRSAPHWLISALSEHTGCNYWEIYHTTLTTFRGRLFAKRRQSGQLHWILPVKNYGMRHENFCQQFCPQCLAEDPIPYFRKQWRLMLFTYCPHHQIRLWDACPACGLPVMHYRGDFGRELWEARPLHACYSCGFDLREAGRREAYFPENEVHRLFDSVLLSLEIPESEAAQFDLAFFAVLHQLCRIVEARSNHGKLRRYVAEQLGCPDPTPPTKHRTVEQYDQLERHQLLLFGLWLMNNLAQRLREAWLAKAVRYNLMIRDFEEMPQWYGSLVEEFSNWRASELHEPIAHNSSHDNSRQA